MLRCKVARGRRALAISRQVCIGQVDGPSKASWKSRAPRRAAPNLMTHDGTHAWHVDGAPSCHRAGHAVCWWRRCDSALAPSWLSFAQAAAAPSSAAALGATQLAAAQHSGRHLTGVTSTRLSRHCCTMPCGWMDGPRHAAVCGGARKCSLRTRREREILSSNGASWWPGCSREIRSVNLLLRAGCIRRLGVRISLVHRRP